MERRARDARATSLPTAGGLTAAWVLVTLVSMLGASPDPELQGAGTQPVGTRGTETGRASDRPEIPLGLDLYLPVPEDNPLSPQRVALGRTLFFDPILSRDQRLACVGCHDPARAFTDGRARSVGVFGRVGTRSVPTLVNRAYGRSFFGYIRISQLMKCADEAVSLRFRRVSQGTQLAGNVRRNIEVTNGQVNHVGEVVRV